jgi:acetyltransferase-like isoleucine patch superfamily enzyme
MIGNEYKEYVIKIKSRNKKRFIIGLIPRFFNYYKSELINNIARIKGAKIGSNSYINLSLALKANRNLSVGDSSIIETKDLDLRDKIFVGNNVIINKNVTVIRASHLVDSKLFETISNEIIIEDYVWIASNSLILPNCKVIKYGSVVGAGSVLGSSINEDKSIFFGSPAKFVRYRKEVYSDLVVESLQGRDFKKYIKLWN